MKDASARRNRGRRRALDDALTLQRSMNESQVVEMRYFGGLSIEETAEALRVSANCQARLDDGEVGPELKGD